MPLVAHVYIAVAVVVYLVYVMVVAVMVNLGAIMVIVCGHCGLWPLWHRPSQRVGPQRHYVQPGTTNQSLCSFVELLIQNVFHVPVTTVKILVFLF